MLYAISNEHGCFDKDQAMLETIRFNDADTSLFCIRMGSRARRIETHLRNRVEEPT